jgi:hypothetical protein
MKSKQKLVHFIYNGKEYDMTSEQIMAAYRYQEHQFHLMDAKNSLEHLVFGDEYNEDERKEAMRFFKETYGITYKAASTPDMLEEYLCQFEERFDCNFDENSQWENAVKSVLYEYKEEEETP